MSVNSYPVTVRQSQELWEPQDAVTLRGHEKRCESVYFGYMSSDDYCPEGAFCVRDPYRHASKNRCVLVRPNLSIFVNFCLFLSIFVSF